MSNNKTIVPGIEDANEKEPAFEGRTSEFYQRGKVAPANYETVVRGIEAHENGNEQQGSVRPMATGKPVVGFLYSISRTNLGEYWPLHIGPNTIGSSAKCDIQLKEGTVSSEHAELVVRQLKNPAKIIASITDARSTNGTMINGESLGFSPVECFNGNIITFGENYQCVLILIDTASLNLTVSENFIPVGPQNKEEPIADSSRNFPPFDGNGNQFDAMGTVGLNPTTIGRDKGGTVGM